jgi:GGDEF domain-containing protein
MCSGLVALGVHFLLLLLTCHSAQAIPAVNLAPYLATLANERGSVAVDLRQLWESGWIQVNTPSNMQALNPQEVWAWPQTLFVVNPVLARQVLNRDQRYIARLELISASNGPDMNVTFKMPRLDAVHVAFRYGTGAWAQASAGDTIPIAKWPFVDRQPSFDIPLRQGTLQLVVEVAHQGVIDAPMVLQNAHSIHQNRMNATVSNGILIGINLVLTVVGVLAALSYRRWSFLALSVMTLLTSAMVSTNSGLAGIYLFTDSAVFNDQSKFFTTALRGLLFPWMTALVLSQRHHARLWWQAAQAWAVMGTAAALWLMQYPLRDVATLSVPLIVLASAALALAIWGNAMLDDQSRARAIAPGILLYALSLLLPLAAYLGFVSTEDALLYSSLVTLVAALVLLYTLVRQHRQGRLVLARAKISVGRDVLTGLLSRKGFERKLDLTVQKLQSHPGYAAFFYIALDDTQTLKDSYGEEGYEIGMVQIAAAISTSVAMADNVGRIAPNVFAVSMRIRHDVNVVNHIAQKILSRTLALASHGVLMAGSVRVALAWMPVMGTLLPDLERRALRALGRMDSAKRIVWVGGEQAQQLAPYSSGGTQSGGSERESLPSEIQIEPQPSLPTVISRLEQEMLGQGR